MASKKRDNFELKINKKFAANYEKSKEKQELARLQQKYGDSQTTPESSSSESEDENAEALTLQVEKDFLNTLSLIKNKDPKIYDQTTTFYKNEGQSESDSSGVKSENTKPVFLKDYERQRILQKGVKALVSDSESDQEEENPNKLKSNDLTYVEEQRQLKESFKVAIEENESEEDDWDDFLKIREKTADEKEKEEVYYKEWLNSVEGPVDKIWNANNLEEDEKFLRNYILNREYHDKDKDTIPSYSNIVDDISSEEDPVEQQEDFERKFNFRYEEPDEDFIKRYPRTIKESTRRTDDKRRIKRQEREERKSKEKDAKIEEIKKLKNLKRKEIMEKIERLKEITGNSKVGFLEDDLDGDFDPSKYDDIMKSVYDNDYYEGDEDEKPVFSDSDASQENWDEWEGDYDYTNEDEEYHCEDPEFNMDADYVPSKEKRKKTSKENRRNSKFAKAVTEKKPVFNPEEKTFEEYFDEYYKLDYEDIIGDLPVRFKYREVLPNNFGLSTEEILKAEDKELNQWCSLRKPMSYITKDEEWRERLRFKKKARNSQKKARVFPSLFSDEGLTADNVSEEQSISNIDNQETAATMKSKRDASSKKQALHSVPGVDKFKGFRSKWKQNMKKQKDDRRKKKKLSSNFKDAKQDFVSKLSSSRLAAYGINTKRKQSKSSKK